MTNPASNEKAAAEQLYESVGMNNEQARQVAELLAGGAVLWRLGHSWISETCVVRPQGCRCHHCLKPDIRIENEKPR